MLCDMKLLIAVDTTTAVYSGNIPTTAKDQKQAGQPPMESPINSIGVSTR